MKIRLQLTRHEAMLRVMTLALLPLAVSLGTAHAQDPINCTGSNGNSKVAVPIMSCSNGVAGSMAYVDVAGLIGLTPPMRSAPAEYTSGGAVECPHRSSSETNESTPRREPTKY